MAIRAISFDFWHTLFMEQPGGYKSYHTSRLRRLEEALRSCGNFTSDQIERACLYEAETHYRVWIEEHRTLPVAERVGRILTKLEACLPDDVIGELVKVYEEGILDRPPVLINGVRCAIEELAGRYRLGIISDVGFSPGRVLKEVLRRNDLLDVFDSMIFSDEAGRSKPHREVFERTARNLNASPREIIHIGDLEHTDVIGAKRAGFHSVRFVGVTPMNEGETTEADFVIDDMSRLPQVIDSLEGEDETVELAGGR